MPQWTDWPLRTAPLVFFDLETTAVRPDRGGRISEIAVVDETTWERTATLSLDE
jgi:DNA polymerase III epsilon subunit-like protein